MLDMTDFVLNLVHAFNSFFLFFFHSYVRYNKAALTNGIKYIDKIESTRKDAKVYFLRYQDFISGKIGIIH